MADPAPMTSAPAPDPVTPVGTQPPVALTVAGSDSGGAAGLQADIKTMAALGVYATTAVTLVTAQNSMEVRDVVRLSPGLVDSQISAVVDDLTVGAVKTGMLGSLGVVEVVARRAAAGDLPSLVVDPVLVTSTGRVTMADEGIDAYRTLLLPHALVATPNLWEAALLAGMEPAAVEDVAGMSAAARRVHAFGPAWVLVKGGHLPGVESDAGDAPDDVVDVLYDGTDITVLRRPRVDTANTHGTGCSLSAAIAAHLSRGAAVVPAVEAATEFVGRALAGGATWHLGGGHGPIDHFGWSSDPPGHPDRR